MALSKKHETLLLKLADSIHAIIAEAKNVPENPKGRRVRGASATTRTRRTGKDLIEFKKAIKKERKAGASVADLAEKYNVTPSYLYQLRD